MSLENVLFHSPWITYNKTFFHSRITLMHPENLIFTVQLLQDVLKKDVYKEHPYAEKIPFDKLNLIDWEKAIIVIDHNLHLLLAPDAVHELVRLDRRLRYKEAASAIFGPFQWFPGQLFRFQEMGILIILLAWGFFWLVRVMNTSKKILVLTSNTRAASKTPRS